MAHGEEGSRIAKCETGNVKEVHRRPCVLPICLTGRHTGRHFQEAPLGTPDTHEVGVGWSGELHIDSCLIEGKSFFPEEPQTGIHYFRIVQDALVLLNLLQRCIYPHGRSVRTE